MRYVLILCLLMACSTSTEITGEVYVVTQGRETIKLSGSEVFVRGRDGVVARVFTDTDGKFRIVLPRGEYSVEVMESRKVGNQTEFYHWRVPVDGHVTLNNSNLLPTS